MNRRATRGIKYYANGKLDGFKRRQDEIEACLLNNKEISVIRRLTRSLREYRDISVIQVILLNGNTQSICKNFLDKHHFTPSFLF